MARLWELDAIAAVVIGGASLFGGRGSILGTLLGTLIMVMIRNGLNLLGVSPFWQGSAIGAIIIVALERIVSYGRRARADRRIPASQPLDRHGTHLPECPPLRHARAACRVKNPAGRPLSVELGPATCATSAMAPSKS